MTQLRYDDANMGWWRGGEFIPVMCARRPPEWLRWRCGMLFRGGSLWIGAHWSSANRRWCVNLITCVTLWVTLPGGKTP